MAEGNGGGMAGNGDLSPLQHQAVHALVSVVVDRLTTGARLGEMYGGDRQVYQALGWKQQLTWDDYYNRYSRQDIAGTIVDKPAEATWREGFELKDDDDPDTETPFEAAWKTLDKRLRFTSWMLRLDRMAGIGSYAVMYLGVAGQDPANPFVRTNPDALRYLTVFQQPQATIPLLDVDPNSDRFGLPEYYDLRVMERTTSNQYDTGAVPRIPATSTPIGAKTIKAHWSRVIHAAESLEETKIFGRPRLQRCYNLLTALELIVGACGEAYWRAARPRLHANIDKDYAGALDSAELARMGDEIAKLLHGMQDIIRTSGTEITTLVPGIADPTGPAALIIDLLAATSRIPKRILMGSERGELASSQDAQEWAHYIRERQTNYAEPVIVRPTIDRFIQQGILPQPTDGEYTVTWPDLTGPNAKERAELAERLAKAEATHAQAELIGKPVLTRNELRETMGLKPIELIEQEYPGEFLEGIDEEPEPEPDDDDAPGEDDDAPDQDQDPDAADDDDDAELEAAASGKSSKAAAKYVSRAPSADKRCDGCTMFRAPSSCTAVRGKIAPGGSCSFFERAGKANLRLNAITLARLTRAVNAATDALFRNATADRIFAAVFDFAGRAAEQFGLVEVDTTTKATRDFLVNYGGERIRSINDTTRKAIAKELTAGMRANESFDLLARRVRRVFKDASAGRAKVIAMTEVNRASGFGYVEGMMQAGVQYKTWANVGDAKVRADHVQMAGQTVPIGQPFVAPDGELGQFPGDFPSAHNSVNCRCFPIGAGEAAALPIAASRRKPRAMVTLAEGSALPKRRAVHERRYLAAVRQALRDQQAAVLGELDT